MGIWKLIFMHNRKLLPRKLTEWIGGEGITLIMKLIIEGYDFLKIFDTLCGQINLLKKLIKFFFNLKKLI